MEPSFSNAPIQNGPADASGGNEKIMAIASLVIGVINLCAWLLPICGIPLALVGVVLGFLGMKDESQRMLAIAGIGLSAFSLLLACGNAIYGVYMATQGMSF